MRQKRHQLAFPGDQPIFFVDSACTKDVRVKMLSQTLTYIFCSVGGVDSVWGKLWLKAISILPLDQEVKPIPSLQKVSGNKASTLEQSHPLLSRIPILWKPSIEKLEYMATLHLDSRFLPPGRSCLAGHDHYARPNLSSASGLMSSFCESLMYSAPILPFRTIRSSRICQGSLYIAPQGEQPSEVE